MGRDRKRMRKVRIKRIISIGKQIEKHEDKIENEKPVKDTTIDYWKGEIEKKFSKQIDKDEDYLGEN